MSEALVNQAWGGRELRGTFMFLAVPALFAVLIGVLEWSLPTVVLYGVAGVMGLILTLRSLRDPEWLLAVSICFFPLSKQYVNFGMGINGTNILIFLMMVSLVWTCHSEGRPWLLRRPGSRTAGWLFVLTALSALTLLLGPYGTEPLSEFKLYIDQFLFYFLVLNLIKDGAMARRLVVYMIVSGVLVAVLGAQEMLDKVGSRSLEASRVEGPQLQPNNFGAFLVYSLAPLIGLFFVYLLRIRSWLMLPYVALVLKVILATFSRGAYIALGISGVVAGYVRGKWFLLLGATLGAIVLISAPQLIPEAAVDRLASTRIVDRYGSEVEASAEARLVVWKASLDVTLDNPLLGVGFGVFPLIKSQYTEQRVGISDTHNMYLYVSTQMGIPAALVFIWLLYGMYRMGVRVFREYPQSFARAIGLGAASMAAGAAVVNMFGSRMTNLEVTCFFWAYLAIISHLVSELDDAEKSHAETHKESI